MTHTRYGMLAYRETIFLTGHGERGGVWSARFFELAMRRQVFLRAELCLGSGSCGKEGCSKHAILRNEPKSFSCLFWRMYLDADELELRGVSFYLGSFWKNEPN